MSLREALKRIAHGIAWLLVTPSALSFAVRSRLLGRDRALEGSTQGWALVPGLAGQYLAARLPVAAPWRRAPAPPRSSSGRCFRRRPRASATTRTSDPAATRVGSTSKPTC